MAMEIYPRSFTGAVNKSSREARAEYIKLHIDQARLDGGSLQMAIDSEDAFDALCSVIGMARQREEIADLESAADQTALVEGAIFPGKRITSS